MCDTFINSFIYYVILYLFKGVIFLSLILNVASITFVVTIIMCVCLRVWNTYYYRSVILHRSDIFH